MKNRQFKLRGKILTDDGDSRLYVADIAQYLAGLAKLHKEEKFGNIELSNGLQSLVNALRPYADYPVSELTNVLKEMTLEGGFKAVSNRIKPELPSKLEDISQEYIEKILDDENYTKQQIIELGNRRFGISKSKLDRLRKKDAVESVRASLQHEKSLDVISEEARKGSRVS